MFGLCLVAVLAVAAYAVSSASAVTPEWGKCVAKTGGKYSEANCQTKAAKGKGTFEWKKGAQLAPVPFTGHNVGSGGVLWTEFGECTAGGGAQTREACAAKSGHRENEGGGPAVECKEETSGGEAVGKDEVKKVHVTFKGCILLGTDPCENTAVSGEIQTKELAGKLGYINKASKEVGVALEPAKKHGVFAEFECPGFPITVKVGVGNSKEGAAHTSSGCDQECPGAKSSEEKFGGNDAVISPIKPVDEMTSTYTQEYKVIGTKAFSECVENTPTKLEGGKVDGLEDLQSNINGELMWSCSGEEITNVNTPSEPGEIKA
jgi:hypothetical protein